MKPTKPARTVRPCRPAKEKIPSRDESLHFIRRAVEAAVAINTEHRLTRLETKLEEIMGFLDDLKVENEKQKAALSKLNEFSNNLSEDVNGLMAKVEELIQGGNLTQAEVDTAREVTMGLEGLSTTLENLAAKWPVPATPTPDPNLVP